MGVLYSFANGGSERLGALIASQLAASGWSIGICATHTIDGPVRDWLARKGVSTFGMEAESCSRIGRRWRIFRLLRRQRIEVLHVQHFSMLALCYWPARLAGVRHIVVTEHNEEPIRAEPRLRRRTRHYGSRADMVTVIHEGIRRYLVDELGLPEARVRTIPNGVDTTRFVPTPRDPAIRDELGARPGDVLFGSVGRLHPYKDQRTLLHAFHHLHLDGTTTTAPMKLALIGDGEERERLEALCEHLGLTDVVRFVGDRDDIERVMPQFDAFVLPSRTEGVPLVLLEAMACAVPCIATAVGGIPDLLRSGGGRMIPPGDPVAMAEVLACFARKPAARRRMGTRGRAIASDRHDLGDMVATYRSMLMEVAGSDSERGCRQSDAAVASSGRARSGRERAGRRASSWATDSERSPSYGHAREEDRIDGQQ